MQGAAPDVLLPQRWHNWHVSCLLTLKLEPELVPHALGCVAENAAPRGSVHRLTILIASALFVYMGSGLLSGGPANLLLA